MNPEGDIVLESDHIVWRHHDDDPDDWNGATFGNWLRFVKGKRVILNRPVGYSNVRLEALVKSLQDAEASNVVVLSQVE